MPAALLLLTAACTRQTAAVQGASPAPSSATSSNHAGVTLILEPRPDGHCCLVSSLNPGDAAITVLCFVEIFDEAGRLPSTHLVPPKPPGHRRSSGFETRPGVESHGFQSIPLGSSDR